MNQLYENKNKNFKSKYLNWILIFYPTLINSWITVYKIIENKYLQQSYRINIFTI